MKSLKKVVSIILLLTLVVSVVGCKADNKKSQETKKSISNQENKDDKDNKKEETEQKPELLEYTYYYHDEVAAKWDNPNDVVTPYIEEKFNIRVKDVITPTSQTFKQMLNQWIAAGNLPDVLNLPKGDIDYAVTTGEFADLSEYIPKMKNYNKYFEDKYWSWYQHDGKTYQIPSLELNLSDEKYDDDPYSEGMAAHGLWVREDILSKLGYSFTPYEDIQKNIIDKGNKPTKADLKVEPAIETPEDYYQLLKKVKELNLKVGDKKVLPLSILSWSQFHYGCMFDFGQWRIDDDGKVAGYLGTPGAKDYYKFLNKLYQEDLIDNDFVLQKNEQLQEKVSSGRVFSGMYVPDFNGALESMKKINPDARLRFLPWPKSVKGKGFFDLYQPGFWRIMIKKDFKDIERLMEYFDWFYSDEGLETITWGPESAGLWEMKDGKKVFKDKELEENIFNGVTEGKNAQYYGLFDHKRNTYWSKAPMSTPVLMYGNPKSYTRSYPPKQDIYNLTKNLLGCNGMNFDGNASYGDGKESTTATSAFFWNQFQNNMVAKLLVATSDEEFDKAWDEVYKEFLNKGKYEQAVIDMEEWFKEYGIK